MYLLLTVIDLAVRPQPVQDEHDYTDAPDFGHLSHYKTAAVGYIAGFVVKMVRKIIHCPNCVAALINTDPQTSNFNLLVKHKTNGGLIEASASVFEICQCTECCLLRMLLSTQGKLPQSQHIVPAIQSVVLEEVIQKGVFSSLEQHMFDSSPDSNHLFQQIKHVSQCYS